MCYYVFVLSVQLNHPALKIVLTESKSDERNLEVSVFGEAMHKEKVNHKPANLTK